MGSQGLWPGTVAQYLESLSPAEDHVLVHDFQTVELATEGSPAVLLLLLSPDRMRLPLTTSGERDTTHKEINREPHQKSGEVLLSHGSKTVHFIERYLDEPVDWSVKIQLCWWPGPR